MHSPLFLCAIMSLAFGLTPLARADMHGVINDPDGFTNLRAKQDAGSGIVAKVKTGEIFTFKSSGGGFPVWVNVTLTSGQTGWMHASRVRFHARLSEIVDPGPDDEANVWARREGFDYYPVARAAAEGEPSAMERYFAFRGDGAAADTHWEVMGTVIHLLGDEKLAKFLNQQSPTARAEFRRMLTKGNTLLPFEPVAYLKRNFSKTAKALQIP